MLAKQIQIQVVIDPSWGFDHQKKKMNQSQLPGLQTLFGGLLSKVKGFCVYSTDTTRG
jgi:hypothetical protein